MSLLLDLEAQKSPGVQNLLCIPSNSTGLFSIINEING